MVPPSIDHYYNYYRIQETAISTDNTPWLVWDAGQVIEDWVQQTLEDQKERPDDYDEIKTEEQLRDDAYEDHDLVSMGYEDVTDILTEWMGDDENWHCEVESFGWRNLNGYKDFRATDGATLLREFLPNTECTFKIWKDADEKKLRIQNFHHDSPTGNEWYTLTPSTEQD